jgi:hypothetical protein
MLLLLQQIGAESFVCIAKIILSAKGQTILGSLATAAQSEIVKNGVLDASTFLSNGFKIKPSGLPEGIGSATYHYFVTTGQLSSDIFGDYYSFNVLTHSPALNHEIDVNLSNGVCSNSSQ